MKTVSALALGLLAAVAPAQKNSPTSRPSKQDPVEAAAFVVGSKIDEDITLRDIRGESHRFGDLRGKVVFLHFWSVSCPAIKASQARLEAIATDYAGRDVVVLGINADHPEIGTDPKLAAMPAPAPKDADDKKQKMVAAQRQAVVTAAASAYGEIVEHVDEESISYPILIDHGNKLADRFKAKTTPHCYVIDAKGVLRYEGALDNDPRGRRKDATSYVRDAIDASLDGETIKKSSTRPYG